MAEEQDRKARTGERHFEETEGARESESEDMERNMAKKAVGIRPYESFTRLRGIAVDSPLAKKSQQAIVSRINLKQAVEESEKSKNGLDTDGLNKKMSKTELQKMAPYDQYNIQPLSHTSKTIKSATINKNQSSKIALI